MIDDADRGREMVAEWYIRREDGAEGPYDLETMRGFARAGVITRRADVSLKAAGPWFAAETTDVFRDTVATPPVSSSSPPPRGKTITALIVAGVLVVAGLLAWRHGFSTGFSTADVEAARGLILKDFESRAGVTVREVVLLRSSSRRLDGYVRLDQFGVTQTLSCSATMADDGLEYVWQCQ